MFTSRFSKKANASLKKNSISKPVAAIPASKSKIVRKPKKEPLKNHSNTISVNNVKRFDFKIEGEEDNKKPVFYIYLYDTLDNQSTGIQLDYVLKSEEPEVDNGFDKCSFLPLYSATNKGSMIQPHFDEVINMYDDIIVAGSFNETNPNGEGTQTTYDCIIISPMRTQIHDSTDFNIKILSDNAENAKTLWVGRYIEVQKEVDGQMQTVKEPHFVKLNIKKYIIENYYLGYGTIQKHETYGTFKPIEVSSEDTESFSVEGIKVLRPTEYTINKDQGDGFVEIKKSFYTNMVNVDYGAFLNFIGKSNLEECENIDYYQYEENQTKSIVRFYGLPGYYTYIKFSEDETTAEVLGSPLLVEVPTLVISANHQYESRIAAKTIQFYAQNTGSSEVPEYQTTDFINGTEYYTYENEKIVRHIPQIEMVIEDGTIETISSIDYLSRETTNKIFKNFHMFQVINMSGSPKVIIKKQGEEDKIVKLQYIKDCSFTDCEIYDQPTTETAIPMWYLDCELIDCDIQLKNYNDLIKNITVIGEEEKTRRRKLMKDGRSYEKQETFIHIKDLDDLYVLLETNHNKEILPDYPELPAEINVGECFLVKTDKKIIYTAKHDNVPATLSLKSLEDESVENCFLFAEIQEGLNEIKFRLGIEDTEADGEYQAHEIILPGEGEEYPVYSTENKKKLLNIYYGIVGTEYGQKVQELLKKIETITNGEGTIVTITPKPYSEEITEKTMAELVKEFNTIMERIPLNLKFIYEVSGILDKIYSFEANRVPYINPSTSEDQNISSETSGFEKPTDTENVGIINGDSYTLREGVTVQKDGENDLYQFKENGSHAKMVEKMHDLLLYCNSFCNEESSEAVTEALYNAAMQFMSSWSEYYPQPPEPEPEPDPETGVDPAMIADCEFEIFEEEAIYKVFVAVENEIGVVESLVSGKNLSNEEVDPLEDFIKTVLEEMKPEIKTIMGFNGEITEFELDRFYATIDPDTETGLSPKAKENKRIEYSQMLQTIQSARNILQASGDTDSFVLKFFQCDKGTFFEILGQETQCTAENAHDENVFAYYIAKGYQQQPSEDQDKKKPVPPRGRSRYYSKAIRKVNKPIEAIPESSSETWRLVKIPKFYSEEPLDWFADNYYSNFIYDQNWQNLSVTIDPEFSDRNKTIYTKISTTNTNPKEQNMIGYVPVNCITTDGNDGNDEP